VHAKHGEQHHHNGYVVVDLSELEYIDGGGLRGLEEGAALCQRGSRELVLVAPPPHIGRILEMAQLTDRLPVLNSVEVLPGRAQLNGDQADKSGEGDVTPSPPGRKPHGARASAERRARQ
jgi:ABC-type transporter Mla MlaB component